MPEVDRMIRRGIVFRMSGHIAAAARGTAMNPPALFATLSLSLSLALAANAHGIEAAAPAASSTPPMATAAATAPASPARSPRRTALPVGAETLPPEWLEAVEPGLSRLTRAPLPTAPKRVAAGAATR
jgi:hypothetical protein